MSKTTRRVLDRKILEALLPECAIMHGTHLAGPGAARLGWFAKWPGGKMQYLGKTVPEATRKLLG